MSRLLNSLVAHLIPDSPFLPFVVGAFNEALPRENVFLIYGAKQGLDRHCLDPGLNFEAIDSDTRGLARVKDVFSSSKLAISHSMSTFAAEAIVSAPSSTLTVWSGWGGDYYGNAFNETAGLLGPQTSRLMKRRRDWRAIAERAYSTHWLHRLYGAAAAAANVFSAPVPTDFDVFRRRFPRFKGRYHQLNYASVEDTYALQPDSLRGSNILVGNSASPENNHLETLTLLSRLDIGTRQVIVPLSYGDSEYGDEIESAGQDLFRDQFVPLRGFMPLDDYSSLISTCSVVVMGHRRQQALGNVARATWQGANVFLDVRNRIVPYFRSVGLPVSTLGDLELFGLPDSPVEDSTLSITRRNARSIWGRDVVLDNIRSLAAPV
jgi:hypothetical protein